jgi:hypothetical protein
MAGRLGAGIRALAGRKAYLAAMAAAGLALLGSLLFVLGLALLWAWLLPAAWGIGSWGIPLALVFWVPFALTVLGFLTVGVRAYTLATTGPPPRTPAGVAGGLTGLGVSVLGPRLAKQRRGPFAWVTDPFGRAQVEGLAHDVPPGHPLAPLLAMAQEQQRNPPARGIGSLALAIVALAAGAWWFLAQSEPALATLLLAPLLVLPVAVAVLAAGLRGVLLGAWDRFLMDRMAATAEQASYAQGFRPYEPRR